MPEPVRLHLEPKRCLCATGIGYHEGAGARIPRPAYFVNVLERCLR